jgi:hypothetical protein
MIKLGKTYGNLVSWVDCVEIVGTDHERSDGRSAGNKLEVAPTSTECPPCCRRTIV